MQLPDGTGSRRFGRIEESQIPDQHHVILILHTKITFLIQVTLLCHGQYPHTLLVHLLTDALGILLQFLRERTHLTSEFRMRTNLQHLFYRSLGDNLTLSLSVFHHHRHPATRKIERNLIHLPVIVLQMFHIQFLHVRQNRFIHQILQSRLEKTVEISMTQNTLLHIPAAIRIDILLQHNLVASQRTRLIGTKNIHRPKILDCIQILHNRLFLRHRHCPLRQIGSHNHRQHLRSQSHSHRNRKDKRFQPVALRQSVYQEHKRNHYQHETNQQEAHLTDTPVESRSCPVSRNALRNRTQIRIVSRTKDNSGSRTTHHIRSHETNVVQFHHTALAIFILLILRTFLNRVRLSRQRRLTDKQVLCLNDTDIRRNHVSRSNHHHIPRNQFRNADFLILLTRPSHVTSICHHFQQRLARHIRLPLLTETKNRTHNHHCRDNHDCRPILLSGFRQQHIQHKRNDNQSGQYPDKRIDKSLYESRNRVFLFLMLHLILPIHFLPVLYLLTSQPRTGCLKISPNSIQRLCRSQKYLFSIKSKLSLSCFLLPHSPSHLQITTLVDFHAAKVRSIFPGGC